MLLRYYSPYLLHFHYIVTTLRDRGRHLVLSVLLLAHFKLIEKPEERIELIIRKLGKAHVFR